MAGYTGCCDGLVYRPGSHLCCPDKTVRYRIHGRYTACCGFDVYRFTTHGCCGEKVYDRDQEVCCDGQLRSRDFGPDTKCCGNATYNFRTQICCDGVILDKPYDRYTLCCQAAVFDYKASVCCKDGSVRDRTYGWNSSCCGGQVYN